MSHMQQPTCTSMRIRSTQDAHKIFYAIQQGRLQMVTRRLDADERQALTSGCIYAWEERGPQSEITGLGIERFTEGRRWSPSRVRDEFLFYYEKYTPPHEPGHPGAHSEKHPPRDWDPLVKQTYSVWVETDKGRRKWHLTAYFTQATIDQLGTVDDLLGIRDLQVPDGHFKSTRVGKSRGKTDDSNTRHGESSKSSTVSRTYAPFPSPYPPYQPQSETSASSQPVVMYEPYQNMHGQVSYSEEAPQTSRFSSPPATPAQGVPLRTSYMSGASSYQRSSSYDGSSQGSPSDPPRAQLNGAVHLQQPYQLSPSYTAPAAGHEHRVNRSSPPYHLMSGGSQASPVPDWRNSSTQDTPNREYASPYAIPPNYSNLPHPASSGSLPSYTEHPQVPPLQTSNHLLYRPLSLEPRQQSLSPLLPPPGSGRRPLSPLQIPGGNYSASFELTPSETAASENRRESIGPCRGLAPLAAIIRSHPYRREPVDDNALRLLAPNKP